MPEGKGTAGRKAIRVKPGPGIPDQKKTEKLSLTASSQDYRMLSKLSLVLL